MKHSTALHRVRTRSLPLANDSLRRKAVALFGILLAVSLLSLCFGSYSLRFFGTDEERKMAWNVFLRLRLPRVLTGILAGGVLGVTGAVCQTVFCNPLASPDITGVASGASFGAAAAILLGGVDIMRIGFAFLGGMGALALLLLLVRLSGYVGTEQRGRYLLAGILVTSAADAGVMVLKTAADPERELAAIEFWTMGSFAAVTDQTGWLMLLSSLPPLILLFAFSGQILILSRGSEEARSVGVSPAKWQILVLLLSTWAVAGVVCAVGVIGFVGLIVPHIALAIGKKRGQTYFFLCFLIGGILTVVADLLARITVPGCELPVSIFCVGFAVLWFAFLFCRPSNGCAGGGGFSC